VEQALEAAFADRHEVVRTEDVGPKIGAELSRNAIQAVAWSLVLILIYISWRFELRFAVGAVISLLHDVTICLGMLALTGRETSLSVVAALLTVVGYSLNDTIVVCDRIREELRLQRRESLAVVINSSINLTLGRTFITGLSTLAVLFVLSVFGGRVINDFAVTLLFGTVIGTYSSIFVASPVVLEWDRLTSRGRKTRRAEG
jgi:preprotein translocase SecF subunit